ncbi:MAG: SNF2-related protein, partial [Blastocatellia bacterium]
MPLGGRITPFFYQIDDVKHIVDEFEERLGGRRGKMIAHEVGLGKTIVAGLTIKELLQRDRLSRVLVLCPASVTEQWQQEMLEKIDEEFQVINPELLSAIGGRGWEAPLAITSIDFIKTHMLEKNPNKRQRRYNPYLLRSTWPAELKYDLVVLDESQFAKSNTAMRYKAAWQLVQQLRDQIGFILLLTATPVMNREEELYYQLALTYPDMLVRPDGTRETPKKSDLKALGEQWVTLRRETIRRKLRRDQDIRPLFAERKSPDDVTFEMAESESDLYSDFARYISDESEYYKLISIRAQAEGSPFLRIVPFIKTTYLREFCSSSDAIYNALVGRDVEENGVWSLEDEWKKTLGLEGAVGGADL